MNCKHIQDPLRERGDWDDRNQQSAVLDFFKKLDRNMVRCWDLTKPSAGFKSGVIFFSSQLLKYFTLKKKEICKLDVQYEGIHVK